MITPLLLLALVASTGSTLAAPATPAPRNLCTSSESWSKPTPISSQNRAWQSLEGLIAGKTSPLFVFAQGLALRALTQEPVQRDAAEYVIARALYQGGQVRAAQGAFAALAERPGTDPRVFAGALGCLNRIAREHPAVALAPETWTRLETTFLARAAGGNNIASGDPDEIMAETALRFLFARLSEDNRTSSVSRETQNRLIALTEGSVYQALATGFSAVSRSDHATAARALAQAQPSTSGASVNPKIAPWHEAATVELARAYYATKRFDQAVPLLQNFSKNSNLLVDALSDLAWTHLLKFGYSSSIGAALSLRLGGLRRTFTPEASMVLAMSLNELCQYPDAIRAVKLFRKEYSDAREWLAAWYAKPQGLAPSGLYPLAAQYLKNPSAKSRVPQRLASEWTRSPLFLSRQDSLNLLFQESASRSRLVTDAAAEQRNLALNLIAFSQELRQAYDAARIKLKPGEDLPGSVQEGLAQLKLMVSDYRKAKAAGPVYSRLLKAQENRKPGEQQRLLAAIERDLAGRSRKLLDRLDEIAENTALIEVEIFNGASQDLLWANAHPDYREVLAKAGAQQETDTDDEKSGSAGVMDWGRSPASRLADTDEEEGEIWEDELGSFKAQLFDNCANRDRYLSIRMKTAEAKVRKQ